jgi:hypothetical protein
MRTLTLGTSTLELAQRLHDSLIGFQPALTREADGWRVTVLLHGDDARFADVMSVLQRHVAARNDRAATLEHEGRTCAVEPI